MAEEIKMNDRKKSLQSPPPPAPLDRRIMILTTTAILFGNITFGCSLTSFSPALESMRSKYNTSIDEISVIFTIMTILYCTGGIACGIISSYINRQLVVIGSLMGLVFSMYMTPHCSTKIVFFVVGGVLGFCSGIYDSSQIMWMIEIWQHKAGPFIQAQHFCFAIGSNIVTFIVAPFLNDYTTISTSRLSPSSSPSIEVEESRIYIPFSILGAFNSLALAFQIFLFIFYRYHSPPMYANENFEQIDDANTIQSEMELSNLSENVSKNQENFNIMGISTRKLKLIALTAMFLGAYQGMEVSTMQFLTVFGQYSDLKMTESASAYVLTGLTGMFAAGRAIGIFIIFKVRPELIICINFLFIIIANVILLAWANNNLIMFWIASIFLGTGYSTMFPSFCAFMEKHLVFTNAIASCIIVSGATTSAIYPLILGKIIEKNAVVLSYTNFFSTVLCIVAMFWGYKLTRKSENRER